MNIKEGIVERIEDKCIILELGKNSYKELPAQLYPHLKEGQCVKAVIDEDGNIEQIIPDENSSSERMSSAKSRLKRLFNKNQGIKKGR